MISPCVPQGEIIRGYFHEINQNLFFKSMAFGGDVCHLESWLRVRFALRSSGQITTAWLKSNGIKPLELFAKPAFTDQA